VLWFDSTPEKDAALRGWFVSARAASERIAKQTSVTSLIQTTKENNYMKYRLMFFELTVGDEETGTTPASLVVDGDSLGECLSKMADTDPSLDIVFC
jgi:hypothetical protein